MKKVWGKTQRKEATSPSMALEETKLIAKEVDVDLVSDAVQFSQDFGLWFGKSVFESTLADVIHREHLGHTAITLIDMLELTAAIYCPEVTRAGKEQMHPQRTFAGFYRYIYESRCELGYADWMAFCQNLSSCIATNCNRLRNEKVPELHAVSMPLPSGDSATPTPATNDSDGTSPFPSPGSSPASSHQQRSVDNSSATNGVVQPQQALQPLAGPAAGPNTDVPSHRYTSVLKEHADTLGWMVRYEKKSLSDCPPSWHCTAFFGDFSGEGVARSVIQAKHAASRQSGSFADENDDR
ncbi:hypothetical protein AALT_g11511 [Alternaria alternata]|nr:hypothetical protein AALT_g11511 [Alternaria alternata]